MCRKYLRALTTPRAQLNPLAIVWLFTTIQGAGVAGLPRQAQRDAVDPRPHDVLPGALPAARRRLRSLVRLRLCTAPGRGSRSVARRRLRAAVIAWPPSSCFFARFNHSRACSWLTGVCFNVSVPVRSYESVSRPIHLFITMDFGETLTCCTLRDGYPVRMTVVPAASRAAHVGGLQTQIPLRASQSLALAFPPVTPSIETPGRTTCNSGALSMPNVSAAHRRSRPGG